MAPRILIIRLSAMGDIIHTLPLLDALRRHWPEAWLGWLCEPGGAQLLEGHPLLDRLHVVPRQAWREGKWKAIRGPMRSLINELRAQRYEIALDIQGLTKSAIWGRLAGVPRRIGFRGSEARELSGLLATERVRPRPQALHVSRRNLALLAPLGIAETDPIHFPVHLPEAARAKALAVLGDDPTPLVIMSPGAGWATKIWAPERYGSLARQLVEEFGCRVGLAWGPGEKELVAKALATAYQNLTGAFDHAILKQGPGIHVLPYTSFIELGAIIARARLFVGGDSGPAHMAAALNIPTVSMMGPLDARRNGPYGNHCVTIQHAIPRPAPFWRNHRRWCDPRTDLKDVTVEEILTPCRKMLGDSIQSLS